MLLQRNINAFINSADKQRVTMMFEMSGNRTKSLSGRFVKARRQGLQRSLHHLADGEILQPCGLFKLLSVIESYTAHEVDGKVRSSIMTDIALEKESETVDNHSLYP